MKRGRTILLGQQVQGTGQVRLDMETLLPTRLLLQATSGGGKSWALRRILEQSHGQVQQIVIDPEGEFASLREKYDYVLVGRGGDIAAEARIAEMLATRLLELGASAVCDLYEMRARERPHFVRLFLDALINAPRRLWRPLLVVVDECHVYCPEKGDSESTDAVTDLCTRGRKRGFCAVLATQRLSNLNKQAAAQCFNVMIGPTSLDIDRKRAVEALGLERAQAKRVMATLMMQEPGQFFCIGRALSKEMVLVQVGGVETHHPEIARGRRKEAGPPPAPERVKAMLGKLADLPQAAEEDLQERTGLKRRIRELQGELRAAKQAVGPRPASQAEIERAVAKALQEHRVALDRLQKESRVTAQRQQRALAEIAEKAAKAAGIEAPETSLPAAKPTSPITKIGNSAPQPTSRRPRPQPTPAADADPEFELGRGGMARMVRVLAQRQPLVMTRAQLATLAGLTNKGGTYGTYLGRLQRAGLIALQGSEVEITPFGLECAGDVPPAPVTVEEHLQVWRDALRTGEREMLDVLVEIYPAAMTREELAERVGKTYTGGTYNTYLSVLRRNGLIDMVGQDVRASETLFMDGER